MTNYYHLTKKELSFISSIQEPVFGLRDQRLSRPVVVQTFKPSCCVSRVYTLGWYKRMVKRNEIDTLLYKYEIFSMF